MKRVQLAHEAVHTGHLILVNAQHACRVNSPALADVPNAIDSVRLCRPAVALLSNLLDGLRAWQRITPVSGWRSQSDQQAIWDQSMLEHGAGFTRKYVALPGHSEHQTGWAIDLGRTQPDIDFIRPDFPYEGICQAFRDRCAQFGFIERYPSGKESITGIAHEPWHFRYVGAPHADIMRQNGFTLEEYVDFLRDYPHGERSYAYRQNGQNISISFLKACDDFDAPISLDETMPYAISGNNVDGFIITEWRH